MQTPLQIAFHDLPSSETVEMLIRRKVDRLERHQSRITGCRVAVEAARRTAEGRGDGIVVKVEVDVPGRPRIVGTGEGEGGTDVRTVETALGAAFEAAERQLAAAFEKRSGSQRGHAGPAEGQMGVVVRLYPDQGHGFIEVAGSPDLYFTPNAVADHRFDELEVGSAVHVTVATGEGPMGPQASSVRVQAHRRSPS